MENNDNNCNSNNDNLVKRGESKNSSSDNNNRIEGAENQETNPNLTSVAVSTDNEAEEVEAEERQVEAPRQLARTPFTNLSQVDADLALARTLQEQERAYMMLTMNAEGSDYGSWEAGSHLHDDDDDEDFHDPHDNTNEHGDDELEDDSEDTYSEEDDNADAFDVHAHAEGEHGDDDNDDEEDEDGDHVEIEFDPEVFSSDEAYARALQEAEEREMAARLFAVAGLNDITGHVVTGHVAEVRGHGGNAQDTWEEVDPDELSYEELLALGEVVGTESRGLSSDMIASLPSVSYKAGSSQSGSNDSCSICQLDYEDDETLTLLSCKHSYHSECINNWLKINKVCPVCSAEVSASTSGCS